MSNKIKQFCRFMSKVRRILRGLRGGNLKERQEINELVANFIKKYPRLELEGFDLPEFFDGVDIFMAVDWIRMLLARFYHHKKLDADQILIWHWFDHRITMGEITVIPALSLHEEVARSLVDKYSTRYSFVELTAIADRLTHWTMMALESQPEFLRGFSVHILQYTSGERVLSIARNFSKNLDSVSCWKVSEVFDD